MYTTEGIILKKIDVGEANALFTIYTKDYGKIRAVAQGVKKEGAKLQGHLEPLAPINDMRGIARYHAEQIGADAGLVELMPEGVLAMTIEPKQGQRYQGIVDLDGATLAECLTNYFATSEQLPTRFWLCADGQHARGLLLQQLPADRLKEAEARAASWQHLATLADTLSAEELLGLDNETLLHRLYHQEALRLFEPRPLCFRCSCSRERSARALVSLGPVDAELLLDEHGGQVVIDCQFCNQRYAFDAADVAQLFAGGGSEAPSDTRH